MVSGLFLSVLSIVYLGVLFAVAFYGERKSMYPSRPRIRPYIYALTLGLYCTTWTFFGAVGTAVRDGWSYLPIYLGPALVFQVAMPFLLRLVSIARAHNITSISDFGEDGPYAGYAATELVAFAMGGMMHRAGRIERPPLGAPGSLAYEAGGVHAAFATLLALWKRMQTGRGQHLDVSVFEATPNGRCVPRRHQRSGDDPHGRHL